MYFFHFFSYNKKNKIYIFININNKKNMSLIKLKNNNFHIKSNNSKQKNAQTEAMTSSDMTNNFSNFNININHIADTLLQFSQKSLEAFETFSNLFQEFLQGAPQNFKKSKPNCQLAFMGKSFGALPAVKHSGCRRSVMRLRLPASRNMTGVIAFSKILASA